MIISHQIQTYRIILSTWKYGLQLVLICILTYLFDHYVLRDIIQFPTIIPAILGPALAFFIVFNNNHAYDRWWEARKIWGSLVNDSRSWARQIVYYLSSQNTEDHLEIEDAKTRVIHRHIGFLYALKSSLRSDDKKHYRKYISNEEFTEVEMHSNKHNAILNLQSKDLKDFVARGWINGFEFLDLNKMLIRFSDEMGMSERIKNTVFPTTYTYYTFLAIWVFVICIVTIFDETIGIWSVIFGIIIGYVFLVIHFIGLAIVNPFDPIPTGISLDQITRAIEIDLLETLKDPDVPPPVKSVNKYYVM